MNQRALIFVICSAIVYFPVVPFLANFGLGVCPLLNEKGFWFGCELNVRFIGFLLFCTIALGVAFQTKMVRALLFRILGNQSINAMVVVFQFVSFLLLLYSKSKLEHVISSTSEMAFAIANILTMVGFATIGFQSILLEVLLTQENRNEFLIIQGSKPARFVSEFITIFQQIITPLLVLGMFFRLSLQLSEMEVSGWESSSDLLQKLERAGVLLLSWNLTINAIAIYGRWKLISQLSLQAEKLENEEISTPNTLEKLGWLEPIGLALNKSSNVLEQKKKISQGFAKFVSNRMLDEIIKKKEGESDLFGQQITAGIIMTDIRDFTYLSSTLQPKQVVRMLNLYFEDMVEALATKSIFIDKFIGDGLLAYLPCEGEWTQQNVALNLIEAAEAMIQKLDSTNRKLVIEGLPKLRLGIGLHIGEVVLGAMGSSQKMQYTIIGDSVNLAARLESLCKSLHTQCVASHELVAILPVEKRQSLVGPTKVDIKGIDELVTVYSFPSKLRAVKAA